MKQRIHVTRHVRHTKHGRQIVKAHNRKIEWKELVKEKMKQTHNFPAALKLASKEWKQMKVKKKSLTDSERTKLEQDIYSKHPKGKNPLWGTQRAYILGDISDDQYDKVLLSHQKTIKKSAFLGGLFSGGDPITKDIRQTTDEIRKVHPLVSQNNPAAIKKERMLKSRLAEDIETKQLIDSADMVTGVKKGGI